MNIYELKGKRDAEKQARSELIQAIGLLKSEMLLDFSAQIETLKIKYAADLESKVAKLTEEAKAKATVTLPTMKGEPGKDAIITEDIKKEIAGMIEVPVVEKEIIKIKERTIVKNQPIVTEKYIENKETPKPSPRRLIP